MYAKIVSLILILCILCVPVLAQETPVPARPTLSAAGTNSDPGTEKLAAVQAEKPTPELTQTPAAEATPEPTEMPTETPAPELTQTPASESAPEPTETPTEASTPEPITEAENETAENPISEETADVLPQAEVYDDGETIELPQTREELLNIVGDYRHILLVGLDSRPGETTGRSDTMILLTLDVENEAIKLTSFMRDMYVSIPGRGGNRLNAAWVFGGPELLLETIEYNFGIQVEHYVAVDFAILADVIDDVGGLEIEIVSEQQKNAINGVIKEDNVRLGLKAEDGLLTGTGLQILTGKQAQAYARYRKYESDFTRTQRQREVIDLLMGKAMDLSFGRLVLLAGEYIGEVETNMGLGEMLGLLPAVLAMRQAEVRQLRLPQDGAFENKTISGMAVLLPNLERVREELETFLSE